MRPLLWLPLLPVLLLCGREAAASSPNSLSQLPAPQHPKIRLYNAEQVLSWQPAPLGNGTRPVVYRVQYKYAMGEWNDVTQVNCTQIAGTECDFTAASLSNGFPMYFNISLRLRAEQGSSTRPG